MVFAIYSCKPAFCGNIADLHLGGRGNAFEQKGKKCKLRHLKHCYMHSWYIFKSNGVS